MSFRRRRRRWRLSRRKNCRRRRRRTRRWNLGQGTLKPAPVTANLPNHPRAPLLLPNLSCWPRRLLRRHRVIHSTACQVRSHVTMGLKPLTTSSRATGGYSWCGCSQQMVPSILGRSLSSLIWCFQPGLEWFLLLKFIFFFAKHVTHLSQISIFVFFDDTMSSRSCADLSTFHFITSRRSSSGLSSGAWRAYSSPCSKDKDNQSFATWRKSARTLRRKQGFRPSLMTPWPVNGRGGAKMNTQLHNLITCAGMC